MSKNYLATIAENTGATQEEIGEVLTGMIISAKNQHGAKASPAEMLVVGSVCAKYQLNPLVKELIAFVSGGKLQVVVPIDGWYKMVNRQENYDGCEFQESFDDHGKIFSCTCKIFHKNRSHPSCATEYFAECAMEKDTWKKWPIRMLRHKAFIQAARMAFGFSEAIDPDEADRYPAERDVNPRPAVDYAAIQRAMAECVTLDELQLLSTQIRQDFEKSGNWEAVKKQIIAMNRQHKDRISASENQGEVMDMDTGEIFDGEVIPHDSSTDEDVAFE